MILHLCHHACLLPTLRNPLRWMRNLMRFRLMRLRTFRTARCNILSCCDRYRPMILHLCHHACLLPTLRNPLRWMRNLMRFRLMRLRTFRTARCNILSCCDRFRPMILHLYHHAYLLPMLRNLLRWHLQRLRILPPLSRCSLRWSRTCWRDLSNTSRCYDKFRLKNLHLYHYACLSPMLRNCSHLPRLYRICP